MQTQRPIEKLVWVYVLDWHWIYASATKHCVTTACQPIANLKLTYYNITHNNLTNYIYRPSNCAWIGCMVSYPKMLIAKWSLQYLGWTPFWRMLYGVHFISYYLMPHIARLSRIAQKQYGVHAPYCKNIVCLCLQVQFGVKNVNNWLPHFLFQPIIPVI
jgi:hypothetical protein